MNFLPAIPELTQQNQGTGFGDWQQYAGYGKDKPFGGSGGIVPPSIQGISPGEQPKSFSDALNKAASNVGNSINNSINGISSRISGAYNNASQGNMYQALQSLNSNTQANSNNGISDDVIGNASGMDLIDKR